MAVVDQVRIDKWLWAARFFKTRALASDAVKGGRVHVNGQAAKPAKDVRPGDRLEITVGRIRFTVDVVATSERRGPPAEAQRLYDETPESRAERERVAELGGRCTIEPRDGGGTRLHAVLPLGASHE